MYLKLKNGNFFEVKDVSSNGNIIGLEKIGNQLEPKEIDQNDIESLQPGFSFETEIIEIARADTDFVEEETEETEETDEEDYIINKLDEPNFEDEQEMKSGFKDKDRISFQRTQLTKPEMEIKAKITKILNLYAINESEIKIFELIEKTMNGVSEVRKRFNDSDTWIKSDEKYIVAGFVFYEIIQSGNSNLLLKTIDDDIYDTYVEKLAERKIFSSKDTAQSIFLMNMIHTEIADGFGMDYIKSREI
jgi:hypothetical protein